MENTRTILVPVDFSVASLSAFETAMEIHAAPGTAVVVVHVVDINAIQFTVELGYGMREDVESKARTHAERAMRRLTDVEPPEGIEVQRVVTVGRPAMEILKLADELVADLIVIGGHPAGSPERVLYGTMPERLLRVARCPVLVIPGPAEEMQLPEPASDLPSGAPSAQ